MAAVGEASLARALLQVTKVAGLFHAGRSPSASPRASARMGRVQTGGGQPVPAWAASRWAGGLEPLVSALCGPYLPSGPRGGVGGGENIRLDFPVLWACPSSSSSWVGSLDTWMCRLNLSFFLCVMGLPVLTSECPWYEVDSYDVSI